MGEQTGLTRGEGVRDGMSRRTFVRNAAIVAGVAAVGGGGWAAMNWAPEETAEDIRTTIGDGMSKVLVVYGTKTGCTSEIAEKIAATLADGDATVDVKPADDKPDPAGYDAVVVGSGVRVGNWHGAAKEFITGNAGALKSIPVAFFTVGLTIADHPEKADEVRAYTDSLIEESGVKPTDIGLFAGWNNPKRLSLPERLIIKVMKAPAGDFRDFDAIAAWSRDVAPKLGLS